MTISPKLFSLVIPTYNEAGNILNLLGVLHKALGDLAHEIIVVDDNSPDLTWKIASDFSVANPWVRVVRRMNNRGLSAAVLDGFAVSKGDYLGVMDADLSHDEAILRSMIRALDNGADLVVGSRRVPGGGAVEWPWYRQLTSNVATLMTKILLRVQLSDPMSGYFVLTKSLYLSCASRLAPMGYKILLEIAYKGRPDKIVEIPFIFKNRTEGYSKLSGRVIQQFLKMLITLSLDQPAQKLRWKYHQGRYKKVARWIKPGTVLDLGCGQPCESMPDGSFLRYLGRGVGVDSKPCQGPFEFIQSDFSKLPFPDKHFDNVVALEIWDELPNITRTLMEVRRILKDDGLFIASMPKDIWFWKKASVVWRSSFGFFWKTPRTTFAKSDSTEALLAKEFELCELDSHWGLDRLMLLRLRSPSENGSFNLRSQGHPKSTQQP